MSSHRALEVLFGVATLVSVVSVPIPRRAQPDTILTARARIDTARVEELKRASDAQRAEVARLTRETRELSLMLRSRHSARDGGTVRTAPDVRGSETENEEHECSQ